MEVTKVQRAQQQLAFDFASKPRFLTARERRARFRQARARWWFEQTRRASA